MGTTNAIEDPAQAFERFMSEVAPRLRRALVARYGMEVGQDVTADSLAYAWEHWSEIAVADNAAGYLYRVGCSAARKHWRWRRRLALPQEYSEPSHVEPGLPAALAKLSPNHRVAVLLIHGWSWSYAEVADLTGVPVSTVRSHVHRGLAQLRRHLGES